MVESLVARRVVKVAVGALHCLALTDKGEVFAWGDNDHYQQGNSSHACNKVPTKVSLFGASATILVTVILL